MRALTQILSCTQIFLFIILYAGGRFSFSLAWEDLGQAETQLVWSQRFRFIILTPPTFMWLDEEFFQVPVWCKK